MVAYNQGISILPVPIMKRFSSSEKIKMVRLKEPELPMEHRHDIQERQIDHGTDEGIYSVVLDNKDNVKDYT